MTRRPAAKFSRATAAVVTMAIAINPLDKSLIVVIQLVRLTLDGAATLARFFNLGQLSKQGRRSVGSWAGLLADFVPMAPAQRFEAPLDRPHECAERRRSNCQSR